MGKPVSKRKLGPGGAFALPGIFCTGDRCMFFLEHVRHGEYNEIKC